MPFHVVHEPGPDVIPVVALHGREDSPSFDHRDGRCFALVGVPEDAALRRCPDYGGVELFCGLINHVGAEALLAFALDEDDHDFFVVERGHSLQKIRWIHHPTVKPPREVAAS